MNDELYEEKVKRIAEYLDQWIGIGIDRVKPIAEAVIQMVEEYE